MLLRLSQPLIEILPEAPLEILQRCLILYILPASRKIIMNYFLISSHVNKKNKTAKPLVGFVKIVKTKVALGRYRVLEEVSETLRDLLLEILQQRLLRRI